MAQLQTHQDMAINQSWQAGQEEYQRSNQEITSTRGGAEIDSLSGRIFWEDIGFIKHVFWKC